MCFVRYHLSSRCHTVDRPPLTRVHRHRTICVPSSSASCPSCPFCLSCYASALVCDFVHVRHRRTTRSTMMVTRYGRVSVDVPDCHQSVVEDYDCGCLTAIDDDRGDRHGFHHGVLDCLVALGHVIDCDRVPHEAAGHRGPPVELCLEACGCCCYCCLPRLDSVNRGDWCPSKRRPEQVSPTTHPVQ